MENNSNISMLSPLKIIVIFDFKCRQIGQKTQLKRNLISRSLILLSLFCLSSHSLSINNFTVSIFLQNLEKQKTYFHEIHPVRLIVIKRKHTHTHTPFPFYHFIIWILFHRFMNLINRRMKVKKNANTIFYLEITNYVYLMAKILR